MPRRMLTLVATALSLGVLSLGLSAQDNGARPAAAPKDAAAAVDGVFAHYFAMRTALARDTVEGVAAEAAALADAATAAVGLAPGLDASLLKNYKQLLTDTALAARGFSAELYTCPMHPAVQAAKAGKCPTCGMALTAAGKLDLPRARETFKKLSSSLIQYAKGVDLKTKAPHKLFLFSCSMAHASWLQEVGEIGNPYYGEAMLKCGELVRLADWSEAPVPASGPKGPGSKAGGGGHSCGGGSCGGGS
ncbi:MAG: DUF3347 domain-containing protein [Planctomycetes bacterium]|nr:DUF3347 domain-containing protein [Planctomycetota bacterium]